MIITLSGKATVTANFKGHNIKTDQPVPAGDGSAPAPFDLFLASLGTCAGIYVKSFCDQRGIPTDGIKLVQNMRYDPEKKLIGDIDIQIQVPAGFPEKYLPALVNAADLCAVKRHLIDPPVIKTSAILV